MKDPIAWDKKERERHRKYYSNLPPEKKQKMIERHHKWNIKNREKVKQYKRKYYANNKEKLSQQKKLAYYAKKINN